MPAPRRFPSPWLIKEMPACFVVRDREGQSLAYVYFEEESGLQSAARLLSKDDAWRVDRARASKLVGLVALGVIRSRHSDAFRNAGSRRL